MIRLFLCCVWGAMAQWNGMSVHGERQWGWGGSVSGQWGARGEAVGSFDFGFMSRAWNGVLFGCFSAIYEWQQIIDNNSFVISDVFSREGCKTCHHCNTPTPYTRTDLADLAENVHACVLKSIRKFYVYYFIMPDRECELCTEWKGKLFLTLFGSRFLSGSLLQISTQIETVRVQDLKFTNRTSSHHFFTSTQSL